MVSLDDVGNSFHCHLALSIVELLDSVHHPHGMAFHAPLVSHLILFVLVDAVAFVVGHADSTVVEID